VRELLAVVVEGVEGGAVAVEAVGETPGLDELEAGWDEEADFFGEGPGQQLLLEEVCASGDCESEGCEGWWLEGRGCSARREYFGRGR
jgi:hypothetical protein